jgi:hypothetical protein
MPRSRPTKLTAQCPSYNNVDEVWKFDLTEMKLKDDSFRESSDLCHIVSINARNNPIEAAPEEVTSKSKRGRGQRGAGGRQH